MIKNIVDPSMKKAVKAYLDDCARKDPALAAVYDQGKIDDCCGYIVDRVRQIYIKANGRKDGGTYSSPEEIFKIARDFFIDGGRIPEDPEVSKAAESQKNEIIQNEPRKIEAQQMDLFANGV